MLLAHSLALFFVMVAFVKIVPTYAMFFEQQEVTLPVATQQLLTWSEFWVAYWYLIFFIGMTMDAAIVLTLALAAKTSRIVSLYSHTFLLVVCALLIYMGAWLSHPVYSLIR